MSQKRVLVLLAPGFEELEAVAVIDILRRAELDVVSAGTILGPNHFCPQCGRFARQVT